MRGFQPSAFQRNAFQMDGNAPRTVVTDGVIAAAAHAWKAQRDRARRRRREQDAQILGRTWLR
jgi:hypothetical protein